MLTSLEINKFRRFDFFQLSLLKRVNLLVGQNNSGKTSILEAIKLLYSQASPADFLELSSERNEYDFHIKEFNSADLSGLFLGRDPEDGSFFSLIGTEASRQTLKLVVTVKCNFKESLGNMIYEAHVNHISDNLSINKQIAFPLYGNNLNPKIINIKHNIHNSGINLLSTQSLTTDEMIDLFNRLVLTPGENSVVEALQAIDSSIERIAPVNFNGHGSFLVKIHNCNRQIPIGSMGDGVWRILGLALSIVNAKDGILLVDEIDTGLHYTAMDDMWKMIWQTANDLNVQVFATTHSNDCWKSLAELASTLDDNSDGIAIHRIEKGHDRSISYTEKEMAIAAERDIEVR
ncbi:AAA family ATPase [Synechocystis sp. FACHB-383]|uniref:AAA family ATPase n=1 Tax=Synechocystis sp. FACHB-383 TaxID=2692864 RepID=UPI0016840553|nr:ATP-binding protein [Synechocystis sp. FACHB-383]MBD2652228.1 AAA family ATPase [Synechocystis sp. FACHB-383]